MKKVHIYGDGACEGNPGPGGYGTILLSFGERGIHELELHGGFRNTTNNRMELIAIIKGFEVLKEKCAVRVFSDSKYVIEALSQGWAVNWRAKGWWRTKRERAKNPDLWGRLLELCEAHDVTYHWVKGHSGNPVQERCDTLAQEARRAPNLPTDKQYEQSVVHEDPQKEFSTLRL